MAVVNGASRLFRQGSGTVAGGRVALRIAPDLLTHLTEGRQVSLVTGTNGKTTTTALLAAALRGGHRFVTSNDTGSNMPAGFVAAVASGERFGPIVLETDEAYLSSAIETMNPALVVLLNLSRDQLDRSSEVRLLAERWRNALGSFQGTVIANADDPLVAFAAATAKNCRWVSGGSSWQLDAVGCPVCDGLLSHGVKEWSCATCGFARPVTEVEVQQDAAELVLEINGVPTHSAFLLPGAFNRSNAAMAVTAAIANGVDLESALLGVSLVGEVAGRFATVRVASRDVTMMLAKNPAGWTALLDLVDSGEGPLILSINARVADGFDPSWLWDVEFERLRGRSVVVTGDRRFDLAVRLHYGEVAHDVCADPVEAVRVSREGALSFIGNYTAFAEFSNKASV